MLGCSSSVPASPASVYLQSEEGGIFMAQNPLWTDTAASQLLAGHVNGSGAVCNPQVVFCAVPAEIKSVLAFRIF